MRMMTILLAALTMSATRLLAQDFVGDCDGSQVVEVNELVLGVRVALEIAPLSACASLDEDGDGRATIGELLRAVQAALRVPEHCGNRVRDAGEQCDDGNRNDGDGCSARCLIEGNGQLDQRWLGRRPIPCGGEIGTTNLSLGPFGQEFRPELPTMTGLSVAVASAVGGDARAGSLHLVVRAGAPDGTVVATADGIAEPPASGTLWYRFDFPEPIAVSPEELYVIVLTSDGDRLMWASENGTVGCDERSYEGGDRLFPDGRDVSSDFLFAVFATPELPIT